MKALIDLHCHSISSGHAYSTIEELAKKANDKGLRAMGVADHAPSMPASPHIYYFSNSTVLPKDINGTIILRGVEANIMDFNGKIDMPEDVLEKLDYAIASLHPPCIDPGTIEENTNAIVNAIKNPYVKIIGHPDDSRYPLNYEKVVKTAKEYGVALEINNSSLRPISFREGAWENVKAFLKLCKQYKAKVILSSDAHFSDDVGEFPNSETIIEEVNFPKELVINYDEESINELIGKKVF